MEDIIFLLEIIDELMNWITQHPTHLYRKWNDQLVDIKERVLKYQKGT